MVQQIQSNMKKLYVFIVLLSLAKFSIGQLTVTTSTSTPSICAGGSSTITATINPNTSDPITYTWTPATGLNTNSGATVIAAPTVTTVYTVNAINNVTNETGSSNVTITIDPASYTLAGVAGVAQVCQNINIPNGGSISRDGNCNIIAAIVPTGSNPVAGLINACVYVDTGANKMGSLDLYVARKYDIEPATNPSTSTASITLYYLQSEFDNFNLKSMDSGLFKIPTGPGDMDGISNLRLIQFHGTGTGPGSYSGGKQTFKSTTTGVSIIWNTTNNWWEITIPVTGFSGFYITSKKGSFALLPISLEYLKGSLVNKTNMLSWKVNCSSSRAVFEIERSTDGLFYANIGYINADQARCAMPFNFTDQNPQQGKNYYRLKIIDVDSKFSYSNIIVLNQKIRKFEMLGINPNLISNKDAVIKVLSEQNNELLLAITDMNGRRIQHQTVKLRQGSNNVKLNTSILSPGGYLLCAYMGGEEPQTIQFIKH